MIWHTTRFAIDLSRPRIMGIVNVTPDSFSDGGRHGHTSLTVRHCEQLVHDGADILDIGGESTRPGSPPLALDEELARVLPVLREAVRLGVPVSVDTCKAEVMQQALDLGADIINDVWALRQPGAAEVVARHRACGICLMHMHRDPQSMQALPMAGNVPPQVVIFLEQRSQYLKAMGVISDRIFVDPGIGFGKTPEQNFSLLADQRDLLALGQGLLVGWSRKRSLGWALDDGAEHASAAVVAQRRTVGSAVAALLAVQRGAHVVRVHDVRETVDAIRVWQAVQSQAAP